MASQDVKCDNESLLQTLEQALDTNSELTEADLSEFSINCDRDQLKSTLADDLSATLSNATNLLLDFDREKNTDTVVELRNRLTDLRNDPDHSLKELLELRKEVIAEYRSAQEQFVTDRLIDIPGVSNVDFKGSSVSFEYNSEPVNFLLDSNVKVTAANIKGVNVLFSGLEDVDFSVEQLDAISEVQAHSDSTIFLTSYDKFGDLHVASSPQNEHYKFVEGELYEITSEIDPNLESQYNAAMDVSFDLSRDLSFAIHELDQSLGTQFHLQYIKIQNQGEKLKFANALLDQFKHHGANDGQLERLKDSVEAYKVNQDRINSLGEEVLTRELRPLDPDSSVLSMTQKMIVKTELTSPIGNFQANLATTTEYENSPTETVYTLSGRRTFSVTDKGIFSGEISTMHDSAGRPSFEIDRTPGLLGSTETSHAITRTGEKFPTYSTAAEASDISKKEYAELFYSQVDSAEQRRVLEIFRTTSGTEDTYMVLRQNAPGREEIDIKIAEIERKYEIPIEVDRDKFQYEPYSVEELGPILDDLDKCLEIYPPGFLEESGLSQIEIYRPLVDEFDPSIHIPGRAEEGVIFVSKCNPVLFHEIDHVIDAQDGMFADDAAWIAEARGNGDPVVYGQGKFKPVGTFLKDGRPEGFPSEYAQDGGPNEDQSVAAAVLLGNDQEVLKQAETEAPLARRLAMKRAEYERLSNGRMDKQFWDDLKNGQTINAKYWADREANGDFN